MSAESDPEWRASNRTFLEQLHRLGWEDGRNLQLEYRWAAGDVERVRAFAKELVGKSPNVLFATSTPTLTALRPETAAIPIVFVQVSDPIGDGFVASFARPGGNITGLTNFEPSMAGKWLEILKEIVPSVKRVALLFNPDTSPGRGSYYSRPIEAAAASFNVRTVPISLHNADEIEPALNAFSLDGNGGLIILSDAFTVVHRKLIIALAARYRLPAIYFFRFFATDGGLVAYGIDRNESYQRIATYVDRILRGAKPADLPIEAPTHFELVINLKTAKALGLDVPLHLQQLANEVIE
jgi:putative ABC transport system substrate-binding protein